MGESRSAVARRLKRGHSCSNCHLAPGGCWSTIPRVEPEGRLFPKTGIQPGSSAGQAFSGSCLARRHVAFILVAAEWPALEPVADRIGRKLGLSGKRGLAVVFATAFGVITETKRRLVVPPAPVVVGGAIEDLVADVGMLEPDANELHEILRLDPD